MSVTYGIPQRIDALMWSLPVSSDRTTPVTFYVYRDGVQIERAVSGTGAAELLIPVASGAAHYIEVLDQNCKRLPAHPGRFTVAWNAVTGAESYVIDEFISPTWTERATIRDDGSGAFTWITRWLEDVTTHQFRVTTVDAGGNEATATTLSALMVRRPNTPSVTVAKSSGALTLDIGAAA